MQSLMLAVLLSWVSAAEPKQGPQGRILVFDGVAPFVLKASESLVFRGATADYVFLGGMKPSDDIHDDVYVVKMKIPRDRLLEDVEDVVVEVIRGYGFACEGSPPKVISAIAGIEERGEILVVSGHIVLRRFPCEREGPSYGKPVLSIDEMPLKVLSEREFSEKMELARDHVRKWLKR